MRYTDAPARREELLRRITAEGYVSSAQLAMELNVSEMTIRRDLRQLSIEGLARRVVGGASLPHLGNHGLPFEARDRAGSSEKRAITAACLGLLDETASIAIDAGTTVASLSSELAPGTLVVSHSAPVIADCMAREDLDLIALGGNYQRDTRSFTGSSAREALLTLSVDVAVLSATAVDRTGMLCANTLDAEIKQGMAAIARTAILLIDHSKFTERAAIRFGSLDAVDIIVTDDGADEAHLDMLREAGIRVVVAPVNPDAAR